MKMEVIVNRTFLLLTILLITLFNVNGQNRWINCVINFEDPCPFGPSYNIIKPGNNNIWQVCTPQKTVFNSAYSLPKAILTDSTGSYPVNNTSSLIIKFLVPPDYSFDVPVIGGYYKMDTDSLNDIGQIEFSLDHGITWLNILSDTVIPWPYWVTPKPILTGRIYQWTEFLATIPNFIPNDTIYYKFTFITDGVQTNQDGWLLDDILLTDHIESINAHAQHHEIFISPNPAGNTIVISGNGLNGEIEVLVLDILGQTCIQPMKYRNNEEIDVSSLAKGLYFVRICNRNSYYTRMVVKD